MVWDLFTGGRLLVCGAGGTAVEWMEEVRTEVAWMEAVRTGGGVGGEGTASYRSVESRWQHARQSARENGRWRTSSEERDCFDVTGGVAFWTISCGAAITAVDSLDEG